MSDELHTIAACDRCGRGYIFIAEWGVSCLACDGRLWFLPRVFPLRFYDYKLLARLAKQHRRHTPTKLAIEATA